RWLWLARRCWSRAGSRRRRCGSFLSRFVVVADDVKRVIAASASDEAIPDLHAAWALEISFALTTSFPDGAKHQTSGAQVRSIVRLFEPPGNDEDPYANYG